MESLTSFLKPLSALQREELDAIGVGPFVLVLLLSLSAGFLVSALYRRFYSSRETGTQIHRAFPLLSLSITAIFISIQFSLPLSLGLLGALSIVRFRTPIKEPEEIGFLMVVIATSLACATFNFRFVGLILVLALMILILQELAPGLLRGSASGGLLMLSLATEGFEGKRKPLLDLVRSRVPGSRLESLTRDEAQVVLAWNFRKLDPAAAAELEAELASEFEPSHLTLSYERNSGL